MAAYSHDLIVIGGGSAGLTTAGGAAMFGLHVALIEAGAMGGECLNNGCVPSKALIAAAARAHHSGAALGVTLGERAVDWRGVRGHVEGAIAALVPADSQERFEAMGVEVLRCEARFLDGRTAQAGNRRLSAPRIVIATGSRPMVPDLPGLESVPFLTNETVFGIDVCPEHLLVLGGGAIGIEMAQAFRRLGAAVTLIEQGEVLAHDDRDAARIVIDRLKQEGVRFVIGKVERAEGGQGAITLILEDGTRLTGSDVLVAVGRQANIEALDLAAAGVEHGEDGIVVDAMRRTSNGRIFAIGDCRGGPRFTHVAGYEGSQVALHIALGWPAKVDWSALPWVTYTDPELAQVGLTEQAARDRLGTVEVTREDFTHNDRAVAEGDTIGFIKMIRHRGKVVGVTIVGARAGELLLPWTQVIAGKASTLALGSAIVAYPTRSEIAKAAAFSAWQPTVFGAWPKRWAGTLARMRRWRG